MLFFFFFGANVMLFLFGKNKELFDMYLLHSSIHPSIHYLQNKDEIIKCDAYAAADKHLIINRIIIREQ